MWYWYLLAFWCGGILGGLLSVLLTYKHYTPLGVFSWIMGREDRDAFLAGLVERAYEGKKHIHANPKKKEG